MHTRTKLILAALAAAIALGALVAAATATRLAVSNQLVRITWNETRPLTFEGGASFGAVRCLLTMEGTFHSRTVVKSPEALIGFVTSATISTCTGGSARALQATLPWHIFYGSFSGTLPRITEINVILVGTSFTVQSNLNGQECLYGATAGGPMKGAIVRNTTTGAAESLAPNENAGFPITSGNTSFANCPTVGFFKGSSATLTVQLSTTKVTVSLVA
jgi:hypothetical protein